MAVCCSRGTITLDGECGVEEALALVEHLAGPGPLTVDLSDCTHLHTALVQALAAGRPPRIVPPRDEFLARWLMPFLAPPTPGTAAKPRRRTMKHAAVQANADADAEAMEPLPA